MLSVCQRLVGLYILYEIYLNENVKTTPFYKLVLDLLARPEALHPAERKLLIGLIKSVPRIAKQTPMQYVKEAESEPPPRLDVDLEPYRKSQTENMPKTTLLEAASISPVVKDAEEKFLPALKSEALPVLDPEEMLFSELAPELLRPTPTPDESYILSTVRARFPPIPQS